MKSIEELLLENIESYLSTGNGRDIIEEATVTLMDDMENRTIRVLVDPTIESLISMLERPNESGDVSDLRSVYGGIKFGDEFCFWERDKSSHNNVASQLRYGNNYVGFYLSPVLTDNQDSKLLTDINVIVTKFSGMGKHDPEGANRELLHSNVIMSLKNTIKSRININTKDTTYMN